MRSIVHGPSTSHPCTVPLRTASLLASAVAILAASATIYTSSAAGSYSCHALSSNWAASYSLRACVFARPTI
eukprot:150347-Prymnesium_polylepis.1